jgi:hypothetical protein
MTALRFGLLSLIALSLACIGGVLWFDPVPAAPAPLLTTAPDVLLASGASIGVGLLIPQLAVAVPGFDSGSKTLPVIVALASTKTPTRSPRPTGQPPLSSSIPAPTFTPGTTFTPAPTDTPAPTQTPAPTRTPLSAVLAGCGSITQPGAFTLGTNLNGNGDCLSVRSDNVVLDCKGLNVTGSAFNGYGIAVRLVGIIPQRTNGVEIRNCNVSGFRYGKIGRAHV